MATKTKAETSAHDWLEAAIARKRRLEQVKCPSCGYVFDWEDMAGWSLVTYWGEDGPHGCECPNCEAALTATERVTREYDVVISTDE